MVSIKVIVGVGVAVFACAIALTELIIVNKTKFLNIIKSQDLKDKENQAFSAYMRLFGKSYKSQETSEVRK